MSFKESKLVYTELKLTIRARNSGLLIVVFFSVEGEYRKEDLNTYCGFQPFMCSEVSLKTDW